MTTPTKYDILETLVTLEDVREDLYSAGWMMAQYLCHLPLDVLGEAFEAIGRYAEAEKKLRTLEDNLRDILEPMGGDEE